jgi:hypothetical protein
MTYRLKKFAPIVSLSTLVLINACRKTDMPANGNTGADPSAIAAPVTLDLIPAQNQTPGDRRIYLPIQKVGTSTLNLTTVFDSGSEGLLLSGTSVFSASYLSDTGIVINSPDSAVINGITVTSAKVTTTYGSPPATRSFYGNIAYAQLTIGDQSGTVMTTRMPFIVIYKGVDNQTQASVPVDANSDGVAGVYSSGFNPSAGLVTTRAGVKSPFNYFHYTNGLLAGFVLSPLSKIGWAGTPSSQGFPATPLLTLGLTLDMETGFALQSQRLDVGNLFDPDVLGTVSYNGITLNNSNVLLDTGTPLGFTIYNSAEGGSTTLSSGAPVQLATREGFSFAYTTDTQLYQTVVQSNGQQRCIFGIEFFLNNSVLFDYSEHYIGLKGS